MGEVINSVTQPFGVKLFSGGPYSDAGMGDKALESLQQAKDQALGVLTGTDWQSLLTREEQQGYNRQVDAYSSAAENAISRLKAQAASRGMPSSYVDALEQRIRQNLMGQMTDARLALYNLVEQKRANMANVIMGAGTQQANTYSNIGQQKAAETAQMQQLVYALLGQGIGSGNILPGVFGGGQQQQGKTGTVGGTATPTGVGVQTGIGWEPSGMDPNQAAFVNALTHLGW